MNIKKFSNLHSYARLLAVLMIVIFHLTDSIYKIYPLFFDSIFLSATHVGSQGIHFFFFSSAFFIYLKYEHLIMYNNIFLKWLLSRLKKIYPNYLASIILIVLLYLSFTDYIFSWESIIISILPIIKNLSQHYIHSINGNFWFLHTLIEFYIVFPFVTAMFQLMKKIYFILLIYAITICYILLYTLFLNIDSSSLNPFTSFFVNYLYDFAFGMLLADYLKKNDITFSAKTHIFFVVTIISFEYIGYLLSQVGPLGRNINDLFFSPAIIIFLLYCSYILNTIKIKQNKIYKIFFSILDSLETKVYDIYLTHHPVISILLTSIYLNKYMILLILLIVILVSFLNSYISNIFKKAITNEKFK